MTGRPSQARGLFTDLYELRMVDSYLRAGMTGEATFSLYVRPTRQRPWFVALGAHRVATQLASFRYGPDEIDYLRSLDFPDATLERLGWLEPSGELWAVPDGEIVLADEPIVEFTGPLPFAQLIETAVINLVQYPTLVATKAARVALAARGRPVVDFGFRRAHGLETGVEAALAAYVGGGMQTSNVEAGRRFGIPVIGTMAHSFVQAHPSELDAFRAFARHHPANVILLVDTYDTLAGVHNAVTVADEMRARGEELRGIRLDSGELAELARDSRRILDEAGHTGVRIFASGGLDEYEIAELVDRHAPIDAFGVGTDLVTSADRPALDIAYKLVAYEGRGVAKYSEAKATLPGAKQIFRRATPAEDVLGLRDERCEGTPLLECVWRNGTQARGFEIRRAADRVRMVLETLPDDWRRPRRDQEPPMPGLSDGLRALAEGVRPR